MSGTQSPLAAFVRTHSYREGDFTLASGKKSPFYIDLKATTLHPQGITLIAETAVEVLLRAELDLGVEIEGVGGLTLGADPLATAISMKAHESRRRHWPAFIVRKEPKGHGTEKYIEGVENLRPGARVAVLEDVVTTGGSGLKAVERLRAEGFTPVLVLTVVDRETGGAQAFQSAGLPLLCLTTLAQVRG